MTASMAPAIRREPNDLLLVKLLGIRHVSLYYNDLDANFPEYRTASAADVVVSREVSDAEAGAVKDWAAGKLGVDRDMITVSIG